MEAAVANRLSPRHANRAAARFAPLSLIGDEAFEIGADDRPDPAVSGHRPLFWLGARLAGSPPETQGFERDVAPDLVAEAEAVDDRFRRIKNSDGRAINAMRSTIQARAPRRRTA